MFNFLCKTLLLRYGNHTVRAASSTCKFKHFQTSLLVKYLSTTSIPHSITVSHLMNSSGLSPESAFAASKYVQHSGSQKNPDLVISFFRSHGFSEAQISKVIRGCPKVLWAKPEETLLPKFEFLYSRGFSGPEIGCIFSVCPSLLHRSLENHIIPNFNYLDDLFKSAEAAVAFIKRSPILLVHHVKTCMAPNINALRDNGVPESNIQLFLRYWPRVFGTNSDTFRNTVEVVKEMGINPLCAHFVNAVYVKGYGNAKWDSKVSVYKRWGWSEEEVLAAFVKYPMFMTASENKIMAVMDFLVNKMHLESSAIAKRPDVIVLSLEKTFVPRAAVIQFLMSNGLIKKQNANLFTVFKYTEKNFLQRFVNCYDEAPQLLKLYQEKLELSKTKQK
ncbi:hypothetical protein LWI28_013371 [Acer negundo]|uniref:Uncharacterized protein n=1 Tax=Acer negundo TaxID=4023 RepID=A0AAD5P0D7_ACENE|nr:hypothetical protein LWI28_013371 [Acer negundo]